MTSPALYLDRAVSPLTAWKLISMHQHRSSETKRAQLERRWRYVTNAFQENRKFCIHMVHSIPSASLSMSFFRCGFQYFLTQCIKAWDVTVLNNMQIRCLKVWPWRIRWKNAVIRRNFVLSGPDLKTLGFFVSVLFTLVNHSSLVG